MPELKPCPFCGSEAMTSWNNKFGWQAFCENDSCFMSQIIATTFETEEQAIQSWNDRTRYDKQESVIRCKDCKHGVDTIINGEYLFKTCGGIDHKPDWFCAHGERR